MPQRLLQPPVAALAKMHFLRVQVLRPACKFSVQGTTVVRIIELHVLHTHTCRPQSLGEVTHGTEDQGDLLRVMQNMAGLFHHLGQQHPVTLGIQRLQGRQLQRELIPQNQHQSTDRHGPTTISSAG